MPDTEAPSTMNVTLDAEAAAIVRDRISKAEKSSGIKPSAGKAASAIIKESKQKKAGA